MNLNIKENSIILAPTYLHTYIRSELLKNKNGLTDITMMTFETFFNSDNNPTVFDYYQKAITLPNIHKHKDNIYKYEFINELKSFIQKKHQYHFSYDSLDTSNDFLKEMKDIIESIDCFPLKEDTIYEVLNTLQDCSNIYILDESATYFKNEIYKQLINKGATRLHFDQNAPHKEYYHALNKRIEIESLAQYIIHNDLNAEDINIMLCDTTYTKFIDSIFYEYNIPYYILNAKSIPIVNVKYHALLSYYLNPDLENSMNLYNKNVFKHVNKTDILQYMDLHKCALEDFYTKEVVASKFINKYEYNQLKNLQKNALLCKQETYDTIAYFLTLEPKDVLLEIDKFLINNHKFRSKEERNGLLNIRKIYKEFKNPTKQDLSFILNHLLTNERKQINICGCSISDLKHPLPNKKYLFVLGASQDNFPAFNSESGIFDEYTFANIKEYPTQEERYNLHIEQVLNNLNHCDHLIVSYSTSTFDGKPKETSLDMNAFMNMKAIDYPYVLSCSKNKVENKLQKDTAYNLFVDHNVIHGSVSSIEKYGECPYKYFLKSGMKLKEPVQYGISVAKVGEIMHYVMEQIAKDDKEHFQDKTIEEIEAIYTPYIQALKDNYPAYELALDELSKRLKQVFTINMLILKDMEDANSLNPEQLEYNFEHDYQISNTLKIELKGIIDRLDESEQTFRIVDYKSSSKDLKEEKVFSGQQLQLLTYATIMEGVLHKVLLGNFYYSFKNPNVNATYAKVSRSVVTKYNIDAYIEEIKNNKKLSGWITSDQINLCDPDKKFINRGRPEKIYDSKILSDLIFEIYKTFADKLLKGEIEINPSEKACEYCPYGSICKNNKGASEKEPWVEIPDNLYIKGGKKKNA